MLVDVNEVLAAFSLAMDIAENQTMEHAQRTAYIAIEIAYKLGLCENDRQDIYCAALLHDIGVTDSKMELHADKGQLISHCVLGEEIIRSLPFQFEAACRYVAWHHASWDGSGPFKIQGEEIPLGAQIVYLADQIDIHMRKLPSIYSGRKDIIEFLNSNSGKLFNPILVGEFMSIQSHEKFWLDYSTNSASDLIRELKPRPVAIGMDDLERLALTFSKIIDNKSPFTHNHSKGVATYASKLAGHLKFNQENIQLLRISGLLHDLGKVAIPNNILDKPGKLTQLEYQIVKSHSYYTKRILSQIRGFDKIKEWAGNHHESLDGVGYPEGLSKQHLGIEDRLMAICDIYQALTEERPYRERRLTQLDAFAILDRQAKDGKICMETLYEFKRMVI